MTVMARAARAASGDDNRRVATSISGVRVARAVAISCGVSSISDRRSHQQQ